MCKNIELSLNSCAVAHEKPIWQHLQFLIQTHRNIYARAPIKLNLCHHSRSMFHHIVGDVGGRVLSGSLFQSTYFRTWAYYGTTCSTVNCMWHHVTHKCLKHQLSATLFNLALGKQMWPQLFHYLATTNLRSSSNWIGTLLFYVKEKQIGAGNMKFVDLSNNSEAIHLVLRRGTPYSKIDHICIL